MNDELPPDDQRLSAFLRRYRPAPPSSQGDLEDYLLARIDQDVQSHPSKGIFWLFSSAIIAGVMMGWVVYRYSSPPQLTATAPELEHFVLESWNRETTDVTYFNNSPSVSSEWLMLTNSNNNYMVAAPQ
jgi:hypothetical protein